MVQKNDSRRLLVKIYFGQCSLGFIDDDEHFFKIKAIISDHNYARKL